MEQVRHGRRLVIGVGNRDRGDDGVGPVVCDLLAHAAPELDTVVLEGNVLDLAAWWEPDDEVVVVDAAEPAGQPGRVIEVDALDDRLVAPSTISTHTVDVGAAVELARAVERLPASLTIIGIEGVTFTLGADLSDEVESAAHQITSDLAHRLPLT